MLGTVRTITPHHRLPTSSAEAQRQLLRSKHTAHLPPPQPIILVGLRSWWRWGHKLDLSLDAARGRRRGEAHADPESEGAPAEAARVEGCLALNNSALSLPGVPAQQQAEWAHC